MRTPDFDIRFDSESEAMVTSFKACELRAVSVLLAQMPIRAHSEVGQTYYRSVRETVERCVREGRIVFDGSCWTTPL